MKDNRTAHLSEIFKVFSIVYDEEDLLDLNIRGYKELDPLETIEALKVAQGLAPNSKDESLASKVIVKKKGSLRYYPQGIPDIGYEERGIYLVFPEGEEEKVFPYIIPSLKTVDFPYHEEFKNPPEELTFIDLSDWK